MITKPLLSRALRRLGDLDDLRFLIRKLSIRSVDEIQKIVDKYYPDDVVVPEHVALLETILEEVRHESRKPI